MVKETRFAGLISQPCSFRCRYASYRTTGKRVANSARNQVFNINVHNRLSQCTVPFIGEELRELTGEFDSVGVLQIVASKRDGIGIVELGIDFHGNILDFVNHSFELEVGVNVL
jgi:hypothetical protein